VWASFALLSFWVRAAVRTDNREDAYNLLLGYPLLLPGFVIVMATVLAVLRSRSSGADELFATLPVGPDRRTVGHGISTITGGALAVVWTAVLLLVLRPDDPIGYTRDTIPIAEAIPRPNLAQLLQGPAAVIAVTAFALALVRWVPSWLVALPLAFAAINQLTFAGLWSGWPVDLTTWLFPLSRGWVNGGWHGCGSEDDICSVELAGFDRITPWWHLGYLVAASVLFVVVAVLRHRRDRTAWSAFAVSLLAVIALAVAQFVVFERYTSPLVGS
jgi:hypothetical protein